METNNEYIKFDSKEEAEEAFIEGDEITLSEGQDWYIIRPINKNI